MVVMGHVITYGITRIDSSIVFRLIGSIHMPLFFFVSGYFAIRMREGAFIMPPIRKRFVQLIIPTIVLSSLWIYYFPHSGIQRHPDCSFAGLWSDLWKNGYWFTIVLFEILIIYGLTAYCANMTSKYGKFARLFPFALMLVLISLGQWLIPDNINHCLSYTFVFKYIFVFLFGGLTRALDKRFMNFAQSSTGYTIVLLLASLILVIIIYPGWLPFKRSAMAVNILQPIFHCALATFAVSLAQTLVANTTENSRAVRFWSFLGRKSLQIYLLHYFFLFPAYIIRPTLISMGLDFVPVAFVAILLSMPIIACVLAVDRLFAPSRILSRIIGNI